MAMRRRMRERYSTGTGTWDRRCPRSPSPARRPRDRQAEKLFETGVPVSPVFCERIVTDHAPEAERRIVQVAVSLAKAQEPFTVFVPLDPDIV